MSTELLAQELTCPICLQLFSEPVMLPCAHNYCVSCIQSATDSEKGPHHCPECRQAYHGIKDIQKNLKLCNIIESYKVTTGKGQDRNTVQCDDCLPIRKPAFKTCLKCEISLCTDHLQAHAKKMSFRNHTLVEPLSNLNSQKCLFHSKSLEFYCATDAAFLCATCFIEGTHYGHDIHNFESAGAEMRCILRADLKLAKEKLQMTSILLQKSLGEEMAFTDASDRLTVKALGILDSMINQLNGYKCRLSKQLEEEHVCKQESWQANINQMTKQQSILKDIQEQAESVLAETDQCLFVHQFLSIKSQLKEALESNVDVPAPPTVDTRHLCALTGTDELKTDMTTLLQALHTLLTPLELTFDPNTVHNSLLLSNDLRTVKYNAGKQVHPEHPERFQAVPQVLCSQGFSGGQHVWVVEVGQCMWSVGVCYRSVPRRGDHSRLGHNSTSWRLQWKNKKLIACHASSTVTLSVTIPPLRLEMALDYSRGTLCFHSIKGRREHLHTFTATFREMVYPAFAIHSTNSESWITLQS